jgi:ubiquinone/menaquinone biosynthesis C-methylase UbiE
MEKEQLIDKVYQLAEMSPVTGAEPQMYDEIFKLPKDITGISILDIGAGMSLFSEAVFQEGAKPIAIDVNYDQPKRLLENFTQTFRAVMNNNSTQDVQASQEYFDQKVQLFEYSFSQLHPDLYIPASATHLPFKPNTFDLVVSLNGIFGTLDVDADLMRAGLNEAIRVVKRGGLVQVAPTGMFFSLSPQERQNQQGAIQELKKNRTITVSETQRMFSYRSVKVLSLKKS